MAWTQVDIDNLQTAIASGELQVQYPNGMVKYRSLDEMERILILMQNALATDTRETRKFASVSKGL